MGKKRNKRKEPFFSRDRIRERKEQISYAFDKMLSRGSAKLLLLLFIVVIFVSFVLGLGAFIFGANEPLDELVWDSFNMMLDPGVLSGAEYGEFGYIFFMFVATIFGLFFTATLIGLINSMILDKMEDLRNTDTKIKDTKHYMIIGYNDRVKNICGELIVSFMDSYYKHVIVVIGEANKVQMNEEIRNYIYGRLEDNVEGETEKERAAYRKSLRKAIRNTSIICRSGKFGDKEVLLNCNVKKARAIIINEFDDFATGKALLSLNSIAREDRPSANDPFIVAVAMKKESAEIFRYKEPWEWEKKILYFGEQISRITAHSCLQPGVSIAFEDLFDYGGNEIYIERPKNFGAMFYDKEDGKLYPKGPVMFQDVLCKMKNAICIGFKRGNEIFINPEFDTLLNPTDRLIIIAQEPYISSIVDEIKVNVKNYDLTSIKEAKKHENLLVLGANENMLQILAEANKYLEDNSTVLVGCTFEQILNAVRGVDVEKYSEKLHDLQYQITNAFNEELDKDKCIPFIKEFVETYIFYQNRETIEEKNALIKCHINFKLMLKNIYKADSFEIMLKQTNKYLEEKEKINHILILSDTLVPADDADEKVLFLLMNLRHHFNKKQNNVNITTEMRRSNNEAIATTSSVDDFIVSDLLVSNMVTQISRNKDLYEIFDNILDSEGAEIYFEPFSDYINFDNERKQEFNFHELNKIVLSKSSKIPIGYRIKNENGRNEVIINPTKETIITIDRNDMVIVVANDK